MLEHDECINYIDNDKCLWNYSIGGCRYRRKPNICSCSGKPPIMARFQPEEKLFNVELQKLGGIL